MARAQLLRAARLGDEGFADAGLLFAFAAGEGLMRRLLSQLQGHRELTETPLAMAKTLVALGELDEDDLLRLADALRDRNAVAHGHVREGDPAASLASAVEVFGRLASELRDA
ncbi:MAG TPA: hypothetical protein VF763_07190 [Candidatus Limnocylindrales bacterium]